MSDLSDKISLIGIPGVYLFEGEKYTVSITDGGVVAVNVSGNPVPPFEVVTRGSKVDIER